MMENDTTSINNINKSINSMKKFVESFIESDFAQWQARI